MCVCARAADLQCTTVGECLEYWSMCSLTRCLKLIRSSVVSGTPWSGQAVKWNWRTERVSAVFTWTTSTDQLWEVMACIIPRTNTVTQTTHRPGKCCQALNIWATLERGQRRCTCLVGWIYNIQLPPGLWDGEERCRQMAWVRGVGLVKPKLYMKN